MEFSSLQLPLMFPGRIVIEVYAAQVATHHYLVAKILHLPCGHDGGVDGFNFLWVARIGT